MHIKIENSLPYKRLLKTIAGRRWTPLTYSNGSVMIFGSGERMVAKFHVDLSKADPMVDLDTWVDRGAKARDHKAIRFPS
jgi:hypothetical protein